MFQITKVLEAAAPGRHFTPDGHLVGCIGEAVAAARYGLELTTASTKALDAHHKASGRSVEIKATVEGKRISLRGMEPEADHLLVLRINGDGAQAKSSTVLLHRYGPPRDGCRATASVS